MSCINWTSQINQINEMNRIYWISQINWIQLNQKSQIKKMR